MNVFHKHHISFKNALNGLIWSIKTQPNFRVHFFFAFLAIFLSVILQVTIVEVAIIVLTIVFCLGCEMVNTSIEAMTDLITQEWKQEAKIAKDVAAGMMLLSAFGAVVIGAIIFLPKIIQPFL